MTRAVPLESEIQKAILEWLAWKHVFHYRQNTGTFVFPETATSKRRFFKAGATGAPDIACVIKGQYVGIECKRPGSKQSPAQREFQKRLEEAGGRYLLATSVDDVATAL
jgi:hypothetical protein